MTGAMADTYEAYKDKLTEYREHLKYVDGAIGLAVAIGNKVVSVDLFDKPSTCRKVWNRLLSGMIMDALETELREERVTKSDTEKLLEHCRIPPGSRPSRPVKGKNTGMVLPTCTHRPRCTQGAVVHGSLIVAG